MIRTKRVKDPTEPSDGLRVLVTRYRPRAVRKGKETWSRWEKRLAPPIALLDAWHGKKRKGRRVIARDLLPISWTEFRWRFRREMEAPLAREAIDELVAHASGGGTVTLLCYCDEPDRCHRTLLAEIIQKRAFSRRSVPARGAPPR